MTRRMVVLVVVLMGLTALVATLAPPARVRREPPRATPQAGARAEPARSPDAPDVTARLDGSAERQHTVRAELGEQVSIVVSTPAADSVALGDLDVQPAEPGVPARFDLLADTPGRYPLVVLSDGHRIGTLEVR